MAMEDSSFSGNRFRRIPRQLCAANLELDPVLNENLEQWPHLDELVQCYKADWVKDESKYGHYESITRLSFQNQIFEGPDTDIETELLLANARQSKTEEATDDDLPSTSGRHINEAGSYVSSLKTRNEHFGESPMPAYEPTFDWENERSLFFGQRIPEALPAQHCSGLKINVKVLSLSFQVGITEPFYGTICLYNRERREKMSEDFSFHVLPAEMQDASKFLERRGIFSLDAPSASVCLLIQLEKPATEEGGVTSSVYSRKKPVHLTEREKQKLQVWSWIMLYKELFAWAIVPLFENNNPLASGSAASPSTPLAPSVSGSNSQDSFMESVEKNTLDGKLSQYSKDEAANVQRSERFTFWEIKAKNPLIDGAHFIEDHHAPSLPAGVHLSRPRVPFQREKIDLAIYTFEDCKELMETHQDKRRSSDEDCKATSARDNFILDLNSRSSSLEEGENVSRKLSQPIFRYVHHRGLVSEGSRGASSVRCLLTLDHVIFDSGGASLGGCFILLDHGDKLFDPGGVFSGGYISHDTFLGISLSHGVASLSHGHVLFDPGGTSTGGYFTPIKVFEAFNFNHQDSKIGLNCQRRVGEQRLWEHTFPQAEFAKNGLNSRRVRFEEGWTDAGAKSLGEENKSLDEDIKQSKVSRVKRIKHLRRIGRIIPDRAKRNQVIYVLSVWSTIRTVGLPDRP